MTKTAEKTPFVRTQDQIDQAKTIAAALKKAKTKEDVAKIWADNYLSIGHKILGRLLIGQEVEDALRMNGKGK